MIMCFLGCMCHVMDGSGMKEALSTIYAANFVDKLLNGHAYARAIRAHMLVRLALGKIIIQQLVFEENLTNCWIGCIEDILLGRKSHTNLLEIAPMCYSLDTMFHERLEDLNDRGPTAQLWVQYIDMVPIAHNFIRAERLGDWNVHLTVVKKMLPYFHASGLFWSLCQVKAFVSTGHNDIRCIARLQHFLAVLQRGSLLFDGRKNSIVGLGQIWSLNRAR
ncbi:unnamed protein product [Brassicogethes aeneus]|uniref:Uncharacterized protein n=1 Tax=Brassicogethes aeneus TaxID=1431903 RepID=A0A9P0BAH2_BRAAE|nr:unnamed protein product [Brassicogethes aeneus]